MVPGPHNIHQLYSEVQCQGSLVLDLEAEGDSVQDLPSHLQSGGHGQGDDDPGEAEGSPGLQDKTRPAAGEEGDGGGSPQSHIFPGQGRVNLLTL